MSFNLRKLCEEKKVTKLSPSLVLNLLMVSLVLQGCSSVKSTLGIDRPAPNEYVVTPCTHPLEMPPDFSCLPTPIPGAERPQDKVARQAQNEKFLGAPGTQGTVSPGQQAILDMSQAQPSQDNVRYQVDQEARMDDKQDKTVLQQLGIQEEPPKGDVIDPYEEAEALGIMRGRSPVVDKN
jgi:Protein of unknown function (DUF3035)